MGKLTNRQASFGRRLVIAASAIAAFALISSVAAFAHDNRDNDNHVVRFCVDRHGNAFPLLFGHCPVADRD